MPEKTQALRAKASKTIPVEAAAGYRKDGTRKKTTGRGDVSPLKASKKLTRPSRKTGRH